MRTSAGERCEDNGDDDAFWGMGWAGWPVRRREEAANARAAGVAAGTDGVDWHAVLFIRDRDEPENSERSVCRSSRHTPVVAACYSVE